jgi:signal transduction histidine kinase
MSEETNPLQILLSAFPDLPDEEAQELIKTGKVCTYPPNTILCREDAIEQTFYIILDGKVNVTKVVDPVDNEVRLFKTLTTGGFFGEMALVQDAPRSASVTTVTTTTVLEIQKQQFDHLMQSSASLSRAMVKEVVRRLRENDTMAIEDLRLKAGELAAAYQQLAEQEFARREFLTTIAHELRTPLTAASGFLQVARGSQLDPARLQATLDTVARNLQHIITLVNDLLFLQEVDLIFAEFQPTDVGAVAKTVIDGLGEKAAQSGVRLSLSIEPGCPAVHGDPKTLERALLALVDNGIKFSPLGGQVQLSVASKGDQVQITVRDQGLGIPPEALPRIFDRFFHTDEKDGYLFGGVGLGLPIARQVIEQHGGTITVESQPGQGSTFTIGLGVHHEPD